MVSLESIIRKVISINAEISINALSALAFRLLNNPAYSKRENVQKFGEKLANVAPICWPAVFCFFKVFFFFKVCFFVVSQCLNKFKNTRKEV